LTPWMLLLNRFSFRNRGSDASGAGSPRRARDHGRMGGRSPYLAGPRIAGQATTTVSTLAAPSGWWCGADLADAAKADSIVDERDDVSVVTSSTSCRIRPTHSNPTSQPNQPNSFFSLVTTKSCWHKLRNRTVKIGLDPNLYQV